jgi:hypothetical protein
MTAKFKPKKLEPVDTDSEYKGLVLAVTEKGSWNWIMAPRCT